MAKQPWLKTSDEEFGEVYISPDGKWKIEPAVNGEGDGNNPDDKWALVCANADCKEYPYGEWVAKGTIEEMTAEAESRPHHDEGR